MGCMRLSTEADRDDGRSDAVIAAAIAAGVELLDTADAYCHDDHDVGHNEGLLSGCGVRVVTKGGLVRPEGAWIADGRARHLAAAARASRDRLGVTAIELYLLHAIDPGVSLATSVRALAKLRADGVVRSIGLSNVSSTQLDAALAIAPIEAVEVELHPWKLDALRGGLIARCIERGIAVLAHRPLGGPAGIKRALRDPVLRAIAERHGATPVEVVLAWLRSLSPAITVLPGPTTIDTARSAVRAQRLALDDEARRALAAQFVEITATPGRPVVARDGDTRPEVVVILGMPGAGKSTIASDYVARGYSRFNRDARGGSLLDLARAIDAELAAGASRIVVDNTYPTRASRAPVIEVARHHGAVTRCIVVATPIEQAQAHAAHRVLERHGRLDGPEVAREIRPNTQFRWRRELEPPSLDEGFAAIDELVPPRRSTGRRPGLIVELDGVIWRGKPIAPDRIELRPGVLDGLAAWSHHPVGATLWRPGAAPERIAAIAQRLGELLGRAIDLRHCAHPAGPPVCWCRKPMPGLALALARDHDLDLARSIHLGRGPADRGFAVRAGMPFVAIAEGWPVPD